MTEADLAEIEARVAAATPGPWSPGRYSDGDYTGEIVTLERANRPHEFQRVVVETDGGQYWQQDKRPSKEQRIAPAPDLVFCAAARSDVPTLITELRRLRAALLLVEFGSCDGCGNKHRCIECGAHGVQDFDPETFDPLPLPLKPEPHKPNCPIGKALGREPSDQ